MSTVPDDEKQQTYEEFNERVNMAPKELEDWLRTEESQSVGRPIDGEGGESKGHRSGRWIVDIKRKKKDELTQFDYDHMRTVANYVNRHTKQRPEGDITNTRWRYSLMNWGHDPLKH